MQMAHIVLVVALCPAVDVVEREEQRLLPRFLVDEIAFLDVGTYQFVAPPCKPLVFR